MTYKRHKVYYFVNKTTKALDSLRIFDIFEDGFVYSYHEEYKFCSFKNAERTFYESGQKLVLLSKLCKLRHNLNFSPPPPPIFTYLSFVTAA